MRGAATNATAQASGTPIAFWFRRGPRSPTLGSPLAVPATEARRGCLLNASGS